MAQWRTVTMAAGLCARILEPHACRPHAADAPGACEARRAVGSDSMKAGPDSRVRASMGGRAARAGGTGGKQQRSMHARTHVRMHTRV